MTATKNPLSGGLIEVARQLAEIRGTRIVEQAALRRSLSAYYALFHALCQLCGEGLGVWTSSAEDLEPAYRHLDHAKAHDVLNSAKARALHDDLPRIGDVFHQLRRLRESADYSQPGRFGGEQKLLTRSEARALVTIAETVIDLLDGLPKDVRRRLAVLLTVRQARR